MSRAAAVAALVTVFAAGLGLWYAIIARFGWWTLAAGTVAVVAVTIKTGRTSRRLSRDLETADRWRP